MSQEIDHRTHNNVDELLAYQGSNSFNKRRGFVFISNEFLNSAEPQLLKLLFERFFPLSAIGRPMDIQYAGFSPHFDEIDQNQTELPTYTFHFHVEEKQGDNIYTLEKVEQIEPPKKKSNLILMK